MKESVYNINGSGVPLSSPEHAQKVFGATKGVHSGVEHALGETFGMPERVIADDQLIDSEGRASKIFRNVREAINAIADAFSDSFPR